MFLKRTNGPYQIIVIMLTIGAVLSAQTSAFADDAMDANVEDYSWIRGANYVPSYARNDVQKWMDYDPKAIDRELGLAARLKLNSVRVFLQYAVYEHDPKLFLERYENFLSLCNKHNLRAMVVVFDSCFGEFPDIENYRDKDWMANPGQNMLGPDHWPELEKYVQDVVGTHRNDDRIVMWDVMNEPLCTSYASTEEGREKIWTFLSHFLDVVKQKDPTHPLTVGYMNSRFIPRLIDKLDVLGWHNYTGDMNALKADIRYVKELGLKHEKPVHMSEIARRNHGQDFSKFLPVLREEKVGWYFWELMLGKTVFSRGENPIQGVVTTDGKSYAPDEIAAIMNVKAKEAAKLFSQRAFPDITDGGTTYKGLWAKWTGDGPRDEYLFYAKDAGSGTKLTFTGTQVALIHKVGPDCSIAEVVLDGKVIKEIDTYAPTTDWNKTTVLTSELTGKNETELIKSITVKVTGRKNPQSQDSLIQIVGFEIKKGSRELKPVKLGCF
jgi:hypothetical protein